MDQSQAELAAGESGAHVTVLAATAHLQLRTPWCPRTRQSLYRTEITMDDTAIEPAVKFKRRKTTHAKRPRVGVDSQDAVAAPQSPSTITDARDEALVLSDDYTSLTLKEILRNRKRPRDRLREAAARAEVTKAQALVRREQDAPKQGYEQRFVPQTGQVVDREDQQMYVYRSLIITVIRCLGRILSSPVCMAQKLTNQYGIYRSPSG